MHVFVTGGSGFVGGRLIETLCGHGDRVSALARTEAAMEAVAERGARPVPGDLSDPLALRDAVRGADLVVHAAAKLRGGPGDRAAFEEVNVVGTARLLDAVRSAEVPALVYVSTEQVVMERGQPLLGADESVPYTTRPIGLYARTKRDAEIRVRDAASGGLRTVVVRPRMVWGRGDTSLLPAIVKAVQTGRFAWIDGGQQLTSTCHVANVVEGILAAAARGRAGEVYFLTDGEPVEFRAFWTELMATQGVDPPRRSMSHRAATAAATAAEGVWRLLGRHGEPPVTAATVELLSRSCTIDDGKARRELGYTGHLSRAEGLGELLLAQH
ncbi:MAG TPA: NAD-dependent epimerase/dehydratase family protein [Micromonosporaceae bacterium]